jgi:hypothetical protein
MDPLEQAIQQTLKGQAGALLLQYLEVLQSDITRQFLTRHAALMQDRADATAVALNAAEYGAFLKLLYRARADVKRVQQKTE